MLELAIRLVFSLAVVLGLLALLAKLGARRFRGGKDAMVRVLHRQSISRGTAVTVVTVGGRVLVLGTTEHQVRVLTELDPEEIADHLPDDVPGMPGEVLALVPTSESGESTAATPIEVPAAAGNAAGGALSGSVLSIDTWRQAFAAATRRMS
ncbi:flagellar biosynthetic protein FliO [Nocardioides sp. LMS-CY]|uniref:flagellar biosynthetic protein FliO n=1 Tax=Nocardioides sp. (strain LMS-CY) TaxID=2840457 RepID=UPI001C001F11|nr:flagellar biosynthetic protein FliO [Nocardioides sp. LMS-CY]QWF23093.1 flagellar biosynthetic protein FliO [Nocardioides sp. LMS-CY]